MALNPVFIAGGQRTPFVKSMTKYRGISNQELMTATLMALVKKYNLKDKVIGDVALGAIMNSSADWNLARECVLGSGLHPRTPAYNVQRACGTGLETTLQLAGKVSLGQISTGISGGVDTNSDLPILISKSLAKKLLDLNAARSLGERMKIFASLRPSDLKPQFPVVVEPRTGLSMGQHCEKMAQEWKIPREAQDEIAFASHQNGARAYKDGFYQDLVFEFKGLKQDGTLRDDTSLAKLAKLKPAFDFSGKGTLTAGNSSPLTDGASAVLLGSEAGLKELGATPEARFVDGESAALDYVAGEELLMAPTLAVARLLARQKLTLQDFDFYEIHEAFAAQVLCTLAAWESKDYCRKSLGLNAALGPVDRSRMNLVGGSVALGHPFAATGGRIVTSLARMLKQKQKGRGLISICTAGGMGVAAIVEAV